MILYEGNTRHNLILKWDVDMPVSYTHLDVYKRQTQFHQCRSIPRSRPTCVRPHTVYKTNWENNDRMEKTSKNVMSVTQNNGVRRMKQKTMTTWHTHIRRNCVWSVPSLHTPVRVYTRSIVGWQVNASRSALKL